MAGISSDLICRVVGGYRFASSGDADTRRFENLNSFMELLGIKEDVGDNVREAAYVPEEDVWEGEDLEDIADKGPSDVEDHGETLERSERSVSEGYVSPEIQQAINDMFKETVRGYLPGGYFDDTEHGKEMSSQFFTWAYTRMRQKLRMDIAKKLKKYQIGEREFDLTPDLMYEIIMDALQYMHDHPSEIKMGLVNAYKGREEEVMEDEELPDEEDGGESGKGDKKETRGRKKKEERKPLGEAEAFFVPRFDESTFEERSQSGGEVKRDDVDPEVVDSLRGKPEVKWRWVDLDEYKVLHFTLPELWGNRVFTMKLPEDIRDIAPGEYTFRIKSVKEGRGAIVEFMEQKAEMHSDDLRAIRAPRKGGLGPDQLKNFITKGIVDKFVNYLNRMPFSSFIEKYKGGISVKGNEIGSVEDLEELSGVGESSYGLSKGRGSEETRAKREESRKEERAKINAVIDRWDPEIRRQILRIPENDGAGIVRLISSKFPNESEKKVPSIDSIIGTRPVVEMVLRHIMSPTTPLAGGGKSAPWVHFAIDDFNRMVLRDPRLRRSAEKMVRIKRKDALPDQPVTDTEIAMMFKEASVRNSFNLLVKDIGQVIEANKKAPELQKFFERRRVFRAYSTGLLENDLTEYLLDNDIDITKSEGMKAADKYLSKRLEKLIKAMEQGTRFKFKGEEERIQRAKEEKKRIEEEKRSKGTPTDVGVQREQRGIPEQVSQPVVAQPQVSRESSDVIHLLIRRMMNKLSGQ